jgi:FtsP/CotA-like multicopper oxidase with cupredoxin domain
MIDRLTRRQMIGGLAVAAPLTALGLAGCGGGGDDAAKGATTTIPADHNHGGAVVAAVDHGPVVAPRQPHTAYPAKAPPRSTTRVHTVKFEVDEHLLEIAPDRTMLAWTFARAGKRGTLPGPVLRVTEGDRVDFTLHNTGSLQHSMDFHAAKISWSRHYGPVDPGKSASFSWTAKVPGVFMYHCGVAPVLLHIGQGQHGTIIVDPADESLLPSAREFVIVQTDLYPGNNGATSDYAQLQAATPEFVVFNGYANQYTGKNALRITKGQRVRVFVQNAGAQPLVGVPRDRSALRPCLPRGDLHGEPHPWQPDAQPRAEPGRSGRVHRRGGRQLPVRVPRLPRPRQGRLRALHDKRRGHLRSLSHPGPPCPDC